MKKLLSLFMLLVILGMGTTAKAVDNLQRIEVKTAQEFVAALKVEFSDANHTQVRGADIHLLCDLDFSNIGSDGTFAENSYICNGQWFGKISGAGVDEDGNETVFALKNLKYTLFEKLVDAEISDLLIAFSKFAGRDKSSGMIADDCENTSIKSIMFIDISAVGDAGSYDCDRMGTAVGNAKNSTFIGLTFFNCNLVTDGENLGHVAGYAENCTIRGCVTDAHSSLWADGNAGNAYVGGICGEANNCQIKDCLNLSVVSSDDDRIGGIVGYGSHGTTVTDCKNGGVVKHCVMDGIGRTNRLSVQNDLLISSISLTIGACIVTGFSYWQYNIFDGEVNNLWNRIQDNWSHMYDSFKAPNGEIVNVFSAKESWNTILDNSKQLVEANGMALGVLGNIGMWLATFFPELTIVAAIVVTACYLSLAYYNSLSSDPDEMGGIVGTMEDGTILRCFNAGAVVCKDDDCGGIAGQLDGSTVESCYNRSFVRGKSDCGGIVGYAYNKSKIKNCLNLGAVTCSDEEGYFGIVGELGSDCSASDNYYLYEENKNHTICESVTQDKVASGWVAKQLNDALIADNKAPIWRQNVGGENADFAPFIGEDDRPVVNAVAAEGSYSVVQNVSNGGDFALACAYPLAQINLKGNVDLSGVSVLMSNFQHPFRGHINGNGFTISNFHYQSSEEDKYLTNDDEDNTRPHDIALFPRATGATFENFIIDGFNITQKDENLVYAYREGLLVGNADHCIFRNINIRNSQIKVNEDNDPKWLVGGLVGLARNTSSSADDLSYFDNITVESTCSFSSFIGNRFCEAYLGGVAGQASKTVFDHCHNASYLSADDDFVGGICGYASGCGFFGCLNSGTTVGRAYVAGIVGRALSCEIKESVNTGMICGDEGDSDNDYIGGIVGSIDGSSSVKYCLNFGDIFKADEYCGGIEGKGYGVEGVDCANNHWYYYLKGTLQTDFKAENSSFGYTPEDIYSGLYAYTATNAEGKKYLYQYLDGTPFCSEFPVPIAVAGKVEYNRCCTDSNSEEAQYSNVFSNKYSYNEHYYVGGICVRCGHKSTDDVPKSIHIDSALGLKAIAYGVNKGVDYQNSTIYLDDDLDFEEETSFMPIGCTPDYPYKGNVDGQKHRIKNLKLCNTNGETGTALFGYVSGTTKIDDLVIDSSCSFSNNAQMGTAALVGCVGTGRETDPVYIYIRKCGNEADVKGVKGVGGLLGTCLSKAYVGIWDSYNTGNITGSALTGAIAGNVGAYPQVNRCWNVGAVEGAVENHGMVGYDYINCSDPSIYNIYQLDDNTSDLLATTISRNDAYLGKIAYDFNTKTNQKIWGQNIGTDALPVFSDQGVRHERNMSSKWGTAILPYYATSDENVQLYELESVDIDASDASITLKEVDMVESHTPFFFKKKDEAATSVRIDITSTSEKSHGSSAPSNGDMKQIKNTAVNGWSLTGTYDDLTDLKEVYFMAQDKLWYAEEPIEVPSFRAFLTYNGNGEQAKSLSILLEEDGETTQIGEIRNGELHMYDGKYLERGKVVILKNGVKYNANGQRLK